MAVPFSASCRACSSRKELPPTPVHEVLVRQRNVKSCQPLQLLEASMFDPKRVTNELQLRLSLLDVADRSVDGCLRPVHALEQS